LIAVIKNTRVRKNKHAEKQQQNIHVNSPPAVG